MRPVKFDPELEEAYHTLFYPFKVNVSVSRHSKFAKESIALNQSPNFDDRQSSSVVSVICAAGLAFAIQATGIAGIRDDNVPPRRRGVRDAELDDNGQTRSAAQRQSQRSQRQQFSASDIAL